MSDLATWCIGHGLFAMSSWGTDCERVHDIFDEVDVELDLRTGDGRSLPSPVVMTAWHSDESLGEALDFFWEHSSPTGGKAYGPTRFVLTVDDGSLQHEVRRWVAGQHESQVIF